MATAKKENIFDDSITVVAEEKKEGYKGPTVRVFLPKLEEEGSGIRVDQYEHVTIGNEQGETRWFIKRGEYIDVPVPVFVVLKDRYPNI